MDVSEKTSNEKRMIPLYKQPWHGSYKSMMDRCYRKTAENFDMYGGRGIKVCDEWFLTHMLLESGQKTTDFKMD